MQEKEDGSRTPIIENTKTVQVGEWLTTNPVQQDGDVPNRYLIGDETFKKKYDATDEPGVYRAKGMGRIIQNDTGAPVEIMAPWGEPQQGEADCYFVANYDSENPDDLSDNRYILSKNDFATYGLASEILN